ncbi:nitroreductase family protein [Trichomonas vaginalis G3]|uniref:Nitroreductase family protein n=1 Tax=Trichomonas vaginalis (strain ATCC PRA-98 / G3) TaxID=412133 RepID=A2FGI6_TRIV3|nr:nitroreductase family protein [Trichomonas vaginalis G3]EAX96000.1 nitroreductase family protein [Trichomonas vaginalis G3]KAI5537669.1 nitroreductase family protein [Trichomonas vaginalis G3]|eukprot:XP_001308930.1 nitroreductase family protein [Trichomonas vaginalis G3]
MSVFDAIDTRRTIRQYDQSFVPPKEHVKKIAEAAIKSPTGYNRQGVDLLVVTNKDIINNMNDKVFDALDEDAKNYFRTRKELGLEKFITCDAPVLYVLYANGKTDDVYARLDAGIMAESILLTATSLGYATMPIGTFMIGDLSEYGIPKDKVLLAIAMGKARAGIEIPPCDRNTKITYLE